MVTFAPQKNNYTKYDKLYKSGEIVNNIAIILAVLSLIALLSKVLSVLIIFISGITLFAIGAFCAVISVGTIYMSDFGKGLWNTFVNIWSAAYANKVIDFAHLVYPYINFISIGLAITSIVLLACSKKKSIWRYIVSSIIILILTITYIFYISNKGVL